MSRMCQPHWDALRSAIDQRGLTAFIPDTGEQAAKNIVRELQDGPSIDTFDPLMASNMAIMSNAMTIAADRYRQNPLIIVSEDPEHPERACPICCLNWLHREHDEHDEHCTQPDCNYPKGVTYDWMIDRAADDQAEYAKGMAT